MSLKHWILPKDHFKTHLLFSIFGWGDLSQLGSWSEGCVKPLKLSKEAIIQVSEDPYHSEFVPCRADHFSFFFSIGGGSGALWKIPLIFFNPSLIAVVFIFCLLKSAIFDIESHCINILDRILLKVYCCCYL